MADPPPTRIHASLLEYLPSKFPQTPPPPPTPHPPSPQTQVFISYGTQTNTSLLQYYGFTEQGNPNDAYQFEATLGGQSIQVRTGGSRALMCGAAVLL